MSALYSIVCFLASILCLATSTPVTQDETVESNLEEVVKIFRDEVTELRHMISALQDHFVTHEASSETNGQDHAQDVRKFLSNHLLRNRRSGDTSLSALSVTFTNESESTTGIDELSRILLGSHSLTPAGGTVYTHWGRGDCADGSELVYSGTATGAHFSHTGGGVNYLCLPQDPIYNEVETSAHGTRSLLYSAEFETNNAQALQNLHDQTPACAVCRAPPTRLTKLMIPGRNECPSSKWRLEYKGYLMSSLYSHKTRTDFVCMDDNATAVPGTTGSQDGALFYMVEARCSPGGIQCAPYVNGYELTCAVCTI